MPETDILVLCAAASPRLSESLYPCACQQSRPFMPPIKRPDQERPR